MNYDRSNQRKDIAPRTEKEMVRDARTWREDGGIPGDNPYWYQRLYQRKAMYYQAAGPLNCEDAEYCCDPGLRYILIGKGFADTELKPYTHVCFHYGYTQRCFINRIDSITIGRGNPEWGAPTDRDVFIIKHHREPSPFVVGKDFRR